MKPNSIIANHCFHCGEEMPSTPIVYDEKPFCCTGCKTVYQVLNQHGLCEYYHIADKPGISQRVQVRHDKFSFLENEAIRQQLIQFADATQTQVTFYLPQMHCASCLWLLEHLQQLDAGIFHSRVDFPRKEVTIAFSEQHTSLRKVAELLTSVGYEPHISLQQLGAKPNLVFDRKRLYRLGVAGFCFSNIMLLSFPEYFGLEGVRELYDLTPVFRYLNLLLSLPVLLYSAAEFFASGWAGIRNCYLNIDAPIALAILITFSRSVFEIVSGTGAGYLDSMSGIVFFMLIGRILQDRTQQSLSFDRDYTAYFPIAVNKLVAGKEVPVPLTELKNGDTIVIHSNEIVPADGILVRGSAAIDYSFVTGESLPVAKKISEIIYAGGRQMGGQIELLLVKEVSQSYLTNLWNKESMKTEQQPAHSWVNAAARYFTLVLFSLTACVAFWWYVHDPSKIWTAVTAALIVACPCSLLLSYSFTNGHVMRAFDKAGLYLKNAGVIERLTRISHIVFDKTGTLTDGAKFEVVPAGTPITPTTAGILATVAAQSNHPVSKAVLHHLQQPALEADAVKELPGLGVEAWIADKHVKFGSPMFVLGHNHFSNESSVVAWSIDGQEQGFFLLKNHYRSGLKPMLHKLLHLFKISVLSGDNNSEEQAIKKLVGKPQEVLFNQSPAGKLQYIEQLKAAGEQVLMVGDGLNDAGALKVADVGIAVADDIHNFSPGCDAIMEASKLRHLHQYLWLARQSNRVVVGSFVLSILYNVVGLSFAFQAKLSPLVAAILMPASSISIMLFTWLGIEWARRRLK